MATSELSRRTGTLAVSMAIGFLAKCGTVLLRESPGILLLGIYFLVVPPAMMMYTRLFRRLFLRMGFVRYMVVMNLLLIMGLLPIKMLCRWLFNLKYFISIPEFMFNL